MTWFGWLIVIDLAISTGLFIVTNDKRKPLTPRELAFKVITHIGYIVGLLLIGSGSL